MGTIWINGNMEDLGKSQGNLPSKSLFLSMRSCSYSMIIKWIIYSFHNPLLETDGLCSAIGNVKTEYWPMNTSLLLLWTLPWSFPSSPLYLLALTPCYQVTFPPLHDSLLKHTVSTTMYVLYLHVHVSLFKVEVHSGLVLRLIKFCPRPQHFS